MTSKPVLPTRTPAPESSSADGMPPRQTPIQALKKAPLPSGRRAIALSTLAAVTLVTIPLGLGSAGLLYPEIFMSLLDGGFEQLSKAKEHYQDGDLPQAIQLAMAIDPESSAYLDAQTAIAQWEQEWQQLQQHLDTIEVAKSQDDWETVLVLAEQLPNQIFWQPQRTELMQQAQAALDRQGRLRMQQAFTAAYDRDFVRAIEHLQRISPRSVVYAQVPAKIAQYEQCRNIRSQYFLQLAFNQAQAQDFDLALSYLQRIDAASPVYKVAQQKIQEYTEKRNQRAQYLIDRAADRATLQDFARAILILQQVSPESSGFAHAQAQILSYGEQLTETPPKAEPFIPPPKVPTPERSIPSQLAEVPLAAVSSTSPLRESSLNPGDRFTEVSPSYWPKP